MFDLSADRERILAPVIRDLELQATPENPEQVVSIDGRVKAPGHYPLEPAMRVSDLIRAGGSLEDAAFRGQAEITRYERRRRRRAQDRAHSDRSCGHSAGRCRRRRGAEAL